MKPEDWKCDYCGKQAEYKNNRVYYCKHHWKILYLGEVYGENINQHPNVEYRKDPQAEPWDIAR